MELVRWREDQAPECAAQKAAEATSAPRASGSGSNRFPPSHGKLGSACLMRIQTRASVSPRQSFSSLIRASISREGDSPCSPSFEPLLLFVIVVLAFFMVVPGPAEGGGRRSRSPLPRRPARPVWKAAFWLRGGRRSWSWRPPTFRARADEGRRTFVKILGPGRVAPRPRSQVQILPPQPILRRQSDRLTAFRMSRPASGLHRPCTGRATEVTRPLSVGLPTSSHIQGKAGRDPKQTFLGERSQLR
jgi:hypothetical protein